MANNMRIGGLASGMDIDSIVSKLMKAERMPLDKLAQRKTTLEWQRDDYRDMNKLLSDFDQLIFDGINRQSQMLKKSATSTNDAAVSAVASANATNTTTSISVTQLAKTTTWSSDNQLSTTFDPSKPLSGQITNTPTTINLKMTQPDGTFKNVGIKMDPTTESLNDVLKKINTNADLNVSAFYDNASRKVVVTSNDTGVGASLVASDIATSDFFTSLGFNVDATTSEITTTAKVAGRDADFTINGFATTRKTNTFTISDVTYTLKQPNQSATVNVATDTNAVVDNIVKFVDKYNEIIEKINGKLTEARYRDYNPLTDQQKESMTDKNIELWEKKARSGLLKNDSILSSGLSKMRMDLYGKVDGITGKYDQLTQIGIKTSSTWRDNGKLIIDEAKLREAVASDPTAVSEMFNGTGGTTFETKGIAKRLRDSIKTTVDQIEAKAGNTLRTTSQYTLGRQLTSVGKQMLDFEDRLKQVEDRYWRQFTAMEKAIQQSNSQAMYMMQQFGGGGGQ